MRALILAYPVRKFLIIACQFALILASAFLAFALRFDFDWSAVPGRTLLEYLIVALPVKLFFNQLFRLNNGWWRYSSVSDMLRIGQATAAAHLIILGAGPFVRAHQAPFPGSIMILDFVLTLLMLGGLRIAMRVLHEHAERRSGLREKRTRRVLIVGAGAAGIGLLREIKDRGRANVEVIGFVDDALSKQRIDFYGTRVLGSVMDIPRLVLNHQIHEIYIAIPSVSKRALNRIVDQCLLVRVPFKTVPSLTELIHSKEMPVQLREVKVEDLLGREPIALERTRISSEIGGRVVMVTGAGGSIGSELGRQILGLSPSALLLFERNEENLFYIDRELRDRFPSATVVPIIGDILDTAQLHKVFETHSPELIYHAAAYKHVPLMEANSRQAFLNNVVGTERVARVSAEHGVKKFVLISTDKAVHPINVMGYSKRLAELVMQEMSRLYPVTTFVAVRFGNVLGSSGSAVEIFRRQIEEGKAVTVTHPDATRFFMTTPEAVELVLHAGAYGKSGEIYMLDMGQPVRIMELAEKMIQLADPQGIRRIEIKVTGLRPGEKLTEELSWEGEDFGPSSLEKVFVLRSIVDTQGLSERIHRSSRRIDQLRSDPLMEMKALVESAEFVTDSSVLAFPKLSGPTIDTQPALT